MFTTLTAFLLTQLRELTFYSVFALVLGSLGTVIFWYEAVRVWRQRP
jgi:hypothetical protein